MQSRAEAAARAVARHSTAARPRRQRYAYYHCPSPAHCRRTNIPRHVREQKFLLLLESLRPRRELLDLFRSFVLEVWKTRREDHAARRAAAERDLADLKRRKDLVEAFVFQKTPVDSNATVSMPHSVNQSANAFKSAIKALNWRNFARGHLYSI